MRAVVQRVLSASVEVNNKEISSIQQGLLLLLAIEESDTQEDLIWLVTKIGNLRIFSDQNGAMNLSIKEVKGSVLVVSQFTLFASTKKGNRPSFLRSAKPEFANLMYQEFINQMAMEIKQTVHSGIFGADMKVSLINDGPVTILIDTKNRE